MDELAVYKGDATTPQALLEHAAHAFRAGDKRLEFRHLAPGERVPAFARRRLVRKPGEELAHLGHRETKLLRRADHRQVRQHVDLVPTLPTYPTRRGKHASRLVVADRRWSDTRPFRHHPNRQLFHCL